MPTALRSTITALLAGGSLLVMTSRGLAGTGDAAAATMLYQDARSLAAGGNHALACPKLEESLRLAPSMTTQYWLADCYEHVGRTASAWAGFGEAASSAKIGRQDERAKMARERAASLEPRLTRLTIRVVAPDVVGLEITRNGALVGKAQWETAIPVDPGSYLVRAAAPSQLPFETRLEVKGAGEVFTVVVPRLTDAAETAAATVAGSTETPLAKVAEPVRTPAVAPRTTRLRTSNPLQLVGLVSAGAGVIGMGVAGLVGWSARARYQDALGHCPGGRCDAEATRLSTEAHALGNTGTWIFCVGAAVTVGGLVTWLVAPNGRPGAPSVDVGLGLGTLVVAGTF
jgi:hypothetical protein